MNQEAYGGPVTRRFLSDSLHLPDWIVNQMYVESEGVYHHPTFLYESVWNIVGIILLFIIRRRLWPKAGELFFSYLIWYSIGRFFVEGLRTDSLAFAGPSWLASLMNGLWSPMEVVFQPGYLDPSYGNVRISQLIALLLVIFCVLLIIIRRMSGLAIGELFRPRYQRQNRPAGWS